MDQSFDYGRTTSNLNSAYNYSPPSRSSRPTSLRDSMFLSGPSRPKFDFDIYDDLTPSYRSLSPPTSIIVHHQPPIPQTIYPDSISKLRQINDELCYTLARCDSIDTPASPVSQYHIHHHPAPKPTIDYHHQRSHSPSDQSSISSVEFDTPLRRSHARLTYDVHIPRQHRMRSKPLTDIDRAMISSSDVFTRDDPMTIDLYPVKDQGFVRQIRNRPDNQKPWLPDEQIRRRNSYSETSRPQVLSSPSPPRTKTINHNGKPLQPKSRLYRPLTDTHSPMRRSLSSNALRPSRSMTSLSKPLPVWQPNGTIKPQKFIGSHAPPSRENKSKSREPIWNPAIGKLKEKPIRRLDPGVRESENKSVEPVWHPPSKILPPKNPKYFEPTVNQQVNKIEQKEHHPINKPKINQRTKTRLPNQNSMLKSRISNAESKVKAAWQASDQQGRPPRIPRPTKEAVPVPVPKPKPKPNPKHTKKSVGKPPTNSANQAVPDPIKVVDTGRSSIHESPHAPRFQSTPKHQSEASIDFETGFGDESNIDINNSKVLERSIQPDTLRVITPGSKLNSDEHTATIPGEESKNNGDQEKSSQQSSVGHDEESRAPTADEPEGSKSKLEVPDEISVVDDEDGIATDHEKEEGSDQENRERSHQNAQQNISIDSVKPNNMTDPKNEEQSIEVRDHDQDADQELSGAEIQHNATEPPASSSPPPETNMDDLADGFFD